MATQLFCLGKVAATPEALTELEHAGQKPVQFLRRHLAGDWGDLDNHDRAVNQWSLTNDGRLFSSYRLASGKTLWVITEADRSVTTLLLPEEY